MTGPNEAPAAGHAEHRPDPGHTEDHGHQFQPIDAARIAVAAVAALCLWFVEAIFLVPGTFFGGVRAFIMQFEPVQMVTLGELSPAWLTTGLPGAGVAIPFSTFGVIGLAFSGWPIFKEAIESIRERKMTMELSMTIAIVAAAYTAHFFVAMIIVFFVLIAEALEGLTVERGRRAIRELVEFLPRTVKVRRGDTVVEVNTDDLKPDEIVMVVPGGLIPVDGTVVGGQTFVDESRITGESMPVEKTAGATVFAGSMNQAGVLDIKAERIGADTSYGKIIEAVEHAESSRAPVTRIADQLAGYIVMIAVAAAAWAQWRFADVDVTISVLVVAGACGVAAGVPLAILGAIGRSARLGAIVKGGVHMEALIRVDTVVFDKTGTLTIGMPRVKSIVTVPGVDRVHLLGAAAAAEFGSEHPLGKAIVASAQEEGIAFRQPTRFEYTPGRGIAAEVSGERILAGNLAWMQANRVAISGLPYTPSGSETGVYIARGERLLGIIAVADTLRPEAAAAVAAIKELGIRTLLLSGDHADVAKAIGAELGIREIEAELLPEQKVDRVKALVASGATVAMVGDGVNDAPALAAASVGVAMGSGTDVARESADVVLLGNNLMRFAETLKLARWANRIIWQNFVGTIVIGLAGISLAFMGIIGPVMAVQVHTFSELIFILNSARVLLNVGSELRAMVAADPILSRLLWLFPRDSQEAATATPNAAASLAARKVEPMFPLHALRPAWTPLTILVMVIAFIIYWPLGLAVIAYILWGNQIPEVRRFFDGQGNWAPRGPAPFSGTGNAAYDDYRSQEMARLDEERARLEKELRDFEDYMRNVRKARDQEEFDRFRRERGNGGR